METNDPTTAYHEAGHVLLAHQLGGEVLETTLESDRDHHAGHTSVAWHGLSKEDRARRSALVALAGPAAETLWRGEEVCDDLTAWIADWNEVDAALRILAAPNDREGLKRRWLEEIVRQLRNPVAWETLCRIADALEAHGTLEQALLEDLLPPPGQENSDDFPSS